MTGITTNNLPPLWSFPSAGPDGADRRELHHRAERVHRRGRRCGGRREDKALHDPEGVAGSVALLAGEQHRGLELLRRPVGESGSRDAIFFPAPPTGNKRWDELKSNIKQLI